MELGSFIPKIAVDFNSFDTAQLEFVDIWGSLLLLLFVSIVVG